MNAKEQVLAIDRNNRVYGKNEQADKRHLMVLSQILKVVQDQTDIIGGLAICLPVVFIAGILVGRLSVL